MAVIKNSLGQSHDLIEGIVKPGDTLIDATAGNGNDTAFLARLAGPSGRVYSFDIQREALSNTEKRLVELGLRDRVALINDGHQNLDLYVKEKVKAVMFNLGYLPGGDHSIGTRGETTATAIAKAMELVSVNGFITVVVYYGGDSGFDEKEYIMDYISGIDNKKFTVTRTEFVNRVNCPPILICIEKLQE